MGAMTEDNGLCEFCGNPALGECVACGLPVCDSCRLTHECTAGGEDDDA